MQSSRFPNTSESSPKTNATKTTPIMVTAAQTFPGGKKTDRTHTEKLITMVAIPRSRPQPAYGRIGNLDVGGTEILGWDPAAGRYFSVFYDSKGGVYEAALGVDGASWTWSGGSTGSTALFSPDGGVQTAHHVRLDGDQWVPSMEVVLRKVI